jgi:hypothetical protein
MSDLAAMLDMDDTTNDDTTSTVLDGNIPDSLHGNILYVSCKDGKRCVLMDINK